MSSGQLTEVPELGLEWRSLVTTIQEQTRQVSALNERHKEVSQAVSHELRTPLSRMRFALALLARCEDAESRDRLQERLLNDVNELESLVRASLTFSRLGHAPAALSRERMGLRDWLEDEVAALEVAPESTHLNIRSKHSEIIGDRGLLHLIVRNLLTNAVRYGRSQVGVVVEDKSDDHLLIHIDDDGPGILQGDLERVFEPFVRLNNQQREANGFGLGLAIVQRAAQWHQAEITIGRSPMGGARFTVSVPIQL
jgi:signal transduction histidine kinase